MTCDKVQYKTYKDAVNAIVAISKRDKQKMTAYKCHDCEQFHITTVRKEMKPTRHEKYKKQVIEYKPAKPISVKKPKEKKIRGKPFEETRGKLMTPEQALFLKQLIKAS